MCEKPYYADEFYCERLPEPEKLPPYPDYPEAFEFLNGDRVGTGDWPRRAGEIRAMYQHYMYGRHRDGTDERLDWNLEEKDGKFALSLSLTRISTGAKGSFTATVSLPEGCKPPRGGFPVIIGMHGGISEDTALKNGFATVTVDGFSHPVASDDTRHAGAFYDLYPYGDSPEEQTGVLMAWGWGCSKIVDALRQGLGERLGISPVNTVVTGVSRWGKAAIVCGAFDRRFKMVAPSCSGAGGVALYRYNSEGMTFDFSEKGGPSDYTYSKNEPLGSLQSPDERGWFNGNFLKFKSPEALPIDQHLLCSLVAEKGRYLFIIGSCIGEDWVNSPAMRECFRKAGEIFSALGCGDNIAANFHLQGHAVIPEDMEKMTGWLRKKIEG